MPIKKSPEEIQLAMKSLQANFDQTLIQKAALLTDASCSLKLHDFSQLPEVISLSHQLAGACGSFGWHYLGRLARQIEVNALLVRDSPDSDIACLNLSDAIDDFIRETNQDRSVSTQPLVKAKGAAKINQDVWLVLPDSEYRATIETQLTAFDFSVRSFSSFADCRMALYEHMPALLFCATRVADELFFSQDALLEHVIQSDTKLLLCSEDDDFEARVNAVRHQAQAFFVGLPDMTLLLQKITRLFDEMNFSDKKVSILDDDLLLAEHYSWVLESAGIEVQIIESPDQAVSDLLSFKPDLLLLDMHMPEYLGSEVSGVIRQYDQLSSLHITFLSAEHDIKQQLQALSFGADDFITKPISNQNLVSTVKLRLARNRDIKSLIERDSLTGLVRHGAIKDTVYSEFDKAKHSGEQFCVAMIDLDHFKNVNDTQGHAVGDVVISTIASLLQKKLRRTDRAGRYGGEEFLVVLPDCSATDAKKRLESLLNSFKSIQFSGSDSHFNCTFSAGIVCSAEGFADADAVIEMADQALYQAKRNGRNQVTMLSSL